MRSLGHNVNSSSRTLLTKINLIWTDLDSGLKVQSLDALSEHSDLSYLWDELQHIIP